MARFKTCPSCDASIKVENIKRHIERAHPGQKLRFDLNEEERAALRSPRRTRPALGRQERWLYPGIAVALVAVLVVVFVLGGPPTPPGQQFCAAENSPISTSLAVPEFAPSLQGVSFSLFVLPDTEGRVVNLAEFAGSVVLLDFMDPNCIHCQRETMTTLVPLHSTYGQDVEFISVSVGFIGPQESPEDVQKFKADCGSTWTYVLDDGTAAPEFGVRSTPTIFILGRDLTIREGPFVGEASYETLSTALDAALLA